MTAFPAAATAAVLAILWQAPSPAAFSEARLAAVLREDTAGYRRLLHPENQACLGPGSGAYLRFLLRHDPTMPSAAPVVEARLAPVPAPVPGADRLTPFVVPPTHTLTVTYRVDATDTRSIGAQVTRSGDRWVEVIGCPTAAALKEIAIRQAALDRRWEEAAAARAGLSTGAAAETERLIKAGRLVEAVTYLTRAGALPLAVARDVAHLVKAALPVSGGPRAGPPPRR